MLRWERLLMALIAMTAAHAEPNWTPKQASLMTRWAAEVSPRNVHPEYPRPQLVRTDWQNLNGLWDFAIQPKTAESCETFDKRILVPFPVEAALSGVMERVSPEQRAWYRRQFEIPADWRGRRIMLHFGAVDWETTVWVNGRAVGTHRGGYDPFSFDITDALRPGVQEIVVAVWDPTDAGRQPRGKQIREPHGIWYTPTTGIWQTVWLEPVAEARVENLRITADPATGQVQVRIDEAHLPSTHELVAIAKADGREVAKTRGGAALELKLDSPRLWSPDNPFLYDLALTVRPRDGADQPTDAVRSYFGVRSVAVKPDAAGVTRIHLNGEPLFMFGPLDQGFWPDGLYTAPTDEALRYDIEITKQLGYNLARKHVKIEPARWYYWCDKLGLLVWQDMPSSEPYIQPSDPDADVEPAIAKQFEQELRQMIATKFNYPSIVMWVVFNEGWGQHDTGRYVELVRKLDPTRLVNAASGWTDRGNGDVHDIHRYPGPASPRPEPQRAAVLGEFGGLGLTDPNHVWVKDRNWSYRSYPSAAAFHDAYDKLVLGTWLLIGDPGLSAAVYTQTTDVERELNGMLTYDRAVLKADLERVRQSNRQLYQPPPEVKTLLPTSQKTGQRWRYTTAEPDAAWHTPAFDDADWDTGVGAFGRIGTPGLHVRTEWHTSDIWLRRTFALDAVPANPRLLLYHDDACEVYINGDKVAEHIGWITSYQLQAIDVADVLRAGVNTIAIHCHQDGGDQGIDAGLIALHEPPPATP